MKYASITILTGMLLIGHTVAAQTILFNGSNLDSFDQLGDANWNISGDVVEATSGNGHLVTQNSYDNFVLSVDFWVDDPANSGIFIRCQDPEMISPDTCYEVNIFDQRADQTYRTGGIVYFAAPAAQINAGGQWNTFEIRAEGSQIMVTLNGVITVDMDDDTFSDGPLTLQYGSGVVRFRNAKIQKL
ncbi:MAG: 3-keto-disaccharide hydrolase [Nitrospinaceae bacterium]|jgi:hypothetical protein|tara:strand:+ start:485 stop:1045 length:561 start_codon:yes stop_codon:yes gene_type:complete